MNLDSELSKIKAKFVKLDNQKNSDDKIPKSNQNLSCTYMLPTCKNGGQFLLELVCHPPSEVMNLTAYDILNTENKLTHTLKGASLRLLLE